MKSKAWSIITPLLLLSFALASDEHKSKAEPNWQVDFHDDFESFNADNWQDQILWVNNEDQCYVRDNQYNTREVSDGTLKLRVINIGEERECDNVDKHGNKHPATRYVAGRIASKNRQEFVKGKWTARLRIHGDGVDGMFPAWWLLGARNDEPPVQEADENICWPLTGSGNRRPVKMKTPFAHGFGKLTARHSTVDDRLPRTSRRTGIPAQRHRARCRLV